MELGRSDAMPVHSATFKEAAQSRLVLLCGSQIILNLPCCEEAKAGMKRGHMGKRESERGVLPTTQCVSLLCFEEPLTASASTALLPYVLENNCPLLRASVTGAWESLGDRRGVLLGLEPRLLVPGP